MIIATIGSITRLTLPCDSNAGNVKQTDFPDPVGCTTMTSLPLFIAAKHCVWNSFNSLMLSCDFAVAISPSSYGSDDNACGTSVSCESDPCGTSVFSTSDIDPCGTSEWSGSDACATSMLCETS